MPEKKNRGKTQVWADPSPKAARASAGMINSGNEIAAPTIAPIRSPRFVARLAEPSGPGRGVEHSVASEAILGAPGSYGFSVIVDARISVVICRRAEEDLSFSTCLLVGLHLRAPSQVNIPRSRPHVVQFALRPLLQVVDTVFVLAIRSE